MPNQDLNGTQGSLVPTEATGRETDKVHYLSKAVAKFNRCTNSAVKILEQYRCQCRAAIPESTQKKLRNLLLYTIIEEDEESEPRQANPSWEYLRSIEYNMKEAYSKLVEQEKLIQQLTQYFHQQFLGSPALQTHGASHSIVDTPKLPPSLFQSEGTQQYPGDSAKTMFTSSSQKERFPINSTALKRAINVYTGDQIKDMSRGTDGNITKQKMFGTLSNANNGKGETLFDGFVDDEFDKLSHRHDYRETPNIVNTQRHKAQLFSNDTAKPEYIHGQHQQMEGSDKRIQHTQMLTQQMSSTSRKEGSQVMAHSLQSPQSRITSKGDRFFRDIPENWLVKLYALLNNPAHSSYYWLTLAWKLSIPPHHIQSWSNPAAYPNPAKLILDTWKVRRESTVGVVRRLLFEMGREDCVQEVDDLVNRLSAIPN